MSEVEDFQSLRKSPLTNNLDSDQVRALVSITYCRTLADGEVLIEEGKSDHTLHILTDGSLSVTRRTSGGDVMQIHVLKTGDMAGELGFVSGRPHTATIQSLGKTKVCSFERDDFEGLIEVHPWLVYRVMQNIVQVGQDILRHMNRDHVELQNYITRSHGRY